MYLYSMCYFRILVQGASVSGVGVCLRVGQNEEHCGDGRER